MPSTTIPAWDKFLSHFQKIEALSGAQAILSWDQQALMPPKAAEQRGNELSYLQGLVHQLVIDPSYEATLTELSNDSNLSADQKAAVKAQLRKVRLKKKVPTRLVEALSQGESRSIQTWQEAKKSNDTSKFFPDLKKLIELKREYAQCIREGDETEYDALVGEYDPEVKASQVGQILGNLRKDLVPLVAEVLERQESRKAPSLNLALPREKQEAMNRLALGWMGFDFEMGRLDTSVHPFCGGAGADVRLTTHYNEKDWTSSFYGVLHEGGHGLYEQGMERTIRIRPMREYAGMSAHESQSRFWENCIGRSRAYCEWAIPQFQAKDLLPRDLDVSSFVAHANRAKRGLIRIYADEATYNLHILLRYEIESDIFAGKLSVDEIPAAWNEKMKSYLGITPSSDSEGCLQDIHWSGAAFGYFPSYALGNLIAAQLRETVDQKLGIDRCIAEGRLIDIRDWLNQNFHSLGCSMNTLEIVKRVTGRDLAHQPFIDYLRAKFLG